MSSKQLYHPFDPIVFSDTRILILGSFPSIKSFKNNFYYAHPRNQFWKILETVTGYPANNRDQKIWLLKECKFGLWDMITSCHRNNSLDTSLKDETVNNIPALLEQHPTISKLAFTGKKSQALFETHFGYFDIERVYLPSPSSAYAAMEFEDKIVAYQQGLKS
ncbi:MAG: DNA-deoxyinosine glycosylase [Sulfurovum sp.]|nr:DNA-deoxyinosine glycosylase [Sulfurovum sp.]MCB4744980.1 DNA-deoxyinosine glycosylase [Sulfurovum sp.]MCB4746633.1 DNA-deoxyinosine glycosylase [Sulfurovum sp.]MCB4747184.1 DNA-deoxyinosine glycosylase [Sulfurovum sp.]MCB4748711.1 DNA-deoxyinosine glycosylase [Sulfurovum sp.]